MNRNWQDLVGKRIDAVYMTPGGELAFRCGFSVLLAGMSGDCCSDSWVGDVVNLPALIGGTVSAVEVLPDNAPRPDLPARVFDDSRGHQESEQYFGFDVRTDKGVCTVVGRNSSNGYYGGSFDDLSERDEVPKGSRQLVDDFSG